MNSTYRVGFGLIVDIRLDPLFYFLSHCDIVRNVSLETITFAVRRAMNVSFQ